MGDTIIRFYCPTGFNKYLIIKTASYAQDAGKIIFIPNVSNGLFNLGSRKVILY